MSLDEPKTKKNGQATADTITDRIGSGKRFIERTLAERDKIACKRYLDGSETGHMLLYDDNGDGIMPEALEVGSVNYLAINIQTKVASIAIGDPDFHIDTGSDDPLVQQMQEGQQQPNLSKQDMAEIVRRFIRTLWELKGWARTFRKALLKRSISGMGILAYLWHDDDGPMFEHVKARDFACDPTVTDWKNLNWGARRIRMRREDAVARYPKIRDLIDTSPAKADNIVDLDGPSPMSKNIVEIWIYHDKATEATVYGEEVLEQGPNLYGRVPLLILEGDIAPESELSMGDYDTCTQIQEMLARLQAMINNQAENGGAVGWYIPSLLSDQSKDAFSDGRPQDFIAVEQPGPEVFGYVEGQPADPMLQTAFEMGQKAMDSATGATEYMRGVINQDVKFATEAAMLSNQSGARGNQARIEFEQFVNFAAKCLLQMVAAFAPSMMRDGDPNDALLLECIASVQDIKVIESSTSYKDPNAEMQLNMQLLQAMMPFIQGGMVNPLPLLADVLRAFGKRDVQKYLNLQPQMPPGGAPGAQPGQGGPMPPPGIAPPPGPSPAQVPPQGTPAPGPVEGSGPPSQAAPSEINVTQHFHGGK